MSIDVFKRAYKNSNTKQLKKYIKLPKVLSTKIFVTYTEASFVGNREVYDILVLILFNQYDLTKVISEIIDRDNVDLLENILSNDYDVELDETLIEKTVSNGRITMAKAIYEYIYDVKKNSYSVILKLLKKYYFVYNKNENTIDSFILAIKYMKCTHAKKIIPYINLDFWNNFAIKYACECDRIGVVKRLLLHSVIDPGVGNNYPLKLAIESGKYSIGTELLKHPLVGVKYITFDFIHYLIHNNDLYVVEKILRLGNNDVVNFFADDHLVSIMIAYQTDMIYLIIKLGIINVSKLIDDDPPEKTNIKKYLKNFKIQNPYILNNYESNLDPNQILKKSLKYDDIDLAKSIKNYPMSIYVFTLLKHLQLYNNSVTDYIYNEILITYNPHLILLSTQPNMFKKIFNIVRDNPKLNCVQLYKVVSHNNKNIMLEFIREKYSNEDYKKFLNEIKIK